MHLLELQNLAKRFDPAQPPAVDDLSLRVEPGEIFGLLGPSGCGKTTTLRMIAGFATPDSGSVRLRDTDITALPPEKRGIGLVFQDYALFPHLSALRNVMFALPQLPRRQRRARALQLLETVGLHGHAEHMPDQLSGGQQQRIAIARALAADPALLLMDEPFSNLDAALRDSTRREIRAILKKANINAILVTHDQEEALSFCDRLAVMNHGRVEQIGCPERIYLHPSTAFVAQFLGRANLLDGVAHGHTADTPLGRIPIRPCSYGPVLLSLRPEHLSLGRPAAGCVDPDDVGSAGDSEHEVVSAGQVCAGVVTSREFRGHDLTYRVEYNGTAYIAHTDYTHGYHPGDIVQLIPREPAVVLEDSPGCRACSPHAVNHGQR
ncbi:ABC transporter ATP-binding protein [Spirochaeta africana]|uniref:ABC-type spermidine/putrescine transport system, ATPase component n=1 Tax=Spirochaeta africana (strain ATCC 700263 / DSM 8902 / Z-7692) TaxID=889378 RepID=H9ULK1_SPIAZ|nr:ABC transporter ATP-binding protein [Spirochaeta africana]AFG38394.1 ABC-type spermidine/putrescine transport system, ATPase component [Spirochaeta africana DSM 8902]